MCIEGIDPCQDDLGALREQRLLHKKRRLRPYVYYPPPESHSKRRKVKISSNTSLTPPTIFR